MPASRDHAIVIGGSQAGLQIARVLSGHFAQVTVVERDTFPDHKAFRPGVPQSRHLHVLWTKGLAVIEQLFPGFGDDLRAAGAPEIRIPADLRWITAAGWLPRIEATRLFTFSRELLDWTMRRRLAAITNLTMLGGHEVTGLTADPSGRTVTGVSVRVRGDGAAETMAADLVVDASGRGARTPEWLAELGYPAPRQTTVDPFLGYASRYYVPPAGFTADWKALYLQARPPHHRRTGGLFPMEDGRWMVSLSGAGRDYGPTGETEFLEFAASLRSPLLFEAITQATPDSAIVAFRRTANHRRHYERLARRPAHLLVTGDAVCAFNPIYGHGISVAALSALALDAMLAGGADFSTATCGRFQRQATAAGAAAWLIATAEDLRYAETEGARLDLKTRFLHAYLDRVLSCATVDPKMCKALVNVLGLVDSPFRLFEPEVLAKAVRSRRAAAEGRDTVT